MMQSIIFALALWFHSYRFLLALLGSHSNSLIFSLKVISILRISSQCLHFLSLNPHFEFKAHLFSFSATRLLWYFDFSTFDISLSSTSPSTSFSSLLVSLSPTYSNLESTSIFTLPVFHSFFANNLSFILILSI